MTAFRTVRRKSRTLRWRLRPASTALVAFGAAIALGAAPLQARAQQIVYDPTAYAKLIQQAETQLQQLEQLTGQVEQAKRLYDSFNQASGVNSLAGALASPALRAVLPDAASYIAAAQGDLIALGQLGVRAGQIRRASRLFTADASVPQGQALEAAGNRAARDLALGQTVADAGAQRQAGLQQLQAGLDTAPTARAVMDLQARLSAEQAMIANDQMRLQGLAIARDGEARIAEQRGHEQSAAARLARMQAYQAMFAK